MSLEDPLVSYALSRGPEYRDSIFESFTRRVFWTNGVTAYVVPAGDVRTWIWSPRGTTGKFTFGIGVEEAGIDFGNVIGNCGTMRTSAIAIAPLALLLGLSFGPRAELLSRFGRPGTVSHLRTTVGVLPGPELVFVPIGIGYRAVFGDGSLVQPFAGTGHVERLSVGLATSLDWTFAGERGPGLQGRVFAGWRF